MRGATGRRGTGSEVMPTSAPPRLGDPSRVALLLDFDGTLVDIAPAPELVVVPEVLRESLLALRRRLDGAVAIVTGRPLHEVDQFLPGVPYAVAAEHGAVIRHGPRDAPQQIELPPMPPHWHVQAEAAARLHEGVRVERKKTGFVLHYRAAPDAGEAMRSLLDGLVAEDPERFHVMAAKMAWEVRAHGADKGSAVAALMAEAPFAGRRPVFIGDDVTDQYGIDAARAMGGLGLMVPDVFGEPADVREWLRRLAAAEGDAWDA